MAMWPLKPKAAKKKKQKALSPERQLLYKQIAVGLVIAVVISLVVTAVWHLTRVDGWQIVDVEVMGGRTIPHSEIQGIAEGALAGMYTRLVPKRFIPLYPESYIEEQILDLDRVKNVHLEISKQKNLVIAFEEHLPHALWCSDLDANECYFIDQNGFAFAQAPDLSGGAFVRYVTNEQPSLQSSVADTDFLMQTSEFSERAESELGLFVTHIKQLGDYDIDYYVSGGGRIKVSQTMSAKESFDNLQAILTSEDFTHIAPGTFNYIDLRFGDKIFVNEVLENESPATTTATSTE